MVLVANGDASIWPHRQLEKRHGMVCQFEAHDCETVFPGGIGSVRAPLERRPRQVTFGAEAGLAGLGGCRRRGASCEVEVLDFECRRGADDAPRR